MKTRKAIIPLILILALLGCSSANPTEDTSTSSLNAQTSAPSPAFPSVESAGELEVHFIDVGQGQSQLVITPEGKTMLIDAGENEYEEPVVGYLRDQGVSRIDVVVVTHTDSDHSGGIDAAIRDFEIGSVYMPRYAANTKTFEDVLDAVADKGLKINEAKAGVVLPLGDSVDVRMVAPVRSYDDANAISAVVKLSYGDSSFLFTGDIEEESEQDIIASGADLQSDVLLVPHHGSNTSTTKELLEAVTPSYAVIQSGEGNEYGHPTETVLSRLEAFGVDVYRNDTDGHIVAVSDGETITFNVDAWSASNGGPVTSAAPPVVPSPASVGAAPAPVQKTDMEIRIKASIDNPTPSQNEEVAVSALVTDGSGKPIPSAHVVLSAHYKSKDSIYEGTTGADGKTTIEFKIGRASAGFTVDIDLEAEFNGARARGSTSFTPQ